MVEYRLPKPWVASSNLVARSSKLGPSNDCVGRPLCVKVLNWCLTDFQTDTGDGKRGRQMSGIPFLNRYSSGLSAVDFMSRNR